MPSASCVGQCSSTCTQVITYTSTANRDCSGCPNPDTFHCPAVGPPGTPPTFESGITCHSGDSDYASASVGNCFQKDVFDLRHMILHFHRFLLKSEQNSM